MPQVADSGARRGVLVAAAVAVGVVGAGGAVYVGLFRSSPGTQAAESTSSHGLPTASVVRTTVATHDLVAGTLGYSDRTASLTAAAGGIVEEVPEAGATVRRGGVLYRLAGQTVLLLYGRVPVWRTLVAGVSGTDVRELNANLHALGYLSADAVDDGFGSQTEAAVRQLQRAAGAEVTGIVTLGDVVFRPGSVHVAGVSVTAGQIVEAGAELIQIASSQQVVSVALDVARQGEVHVGNRVEVELPNGSSADAVVSAVSRVVTSPPADSENPSPTVAVTVRLRDSHATASLDQAPVQVSITTASDAGVLAVPVASLLARPDGSYAVQVVHGTEGVTTPVTPGRFSDTSNLVAISGGSLHVGDRVVVPG
jgi:hypothetical protein